MNREFAARVLTELEKRGNDLDEISESLKDLSADEQKQFFTAAAHKIGLSETQESQKSAKEAVESGDRNAKFYQDEKDIEEHGRQYPDIKARMEQTDEAMRPFSDESAKAAIHGAGETVLGGAPAKVARGITAATQEVVSPSSEAPFKQRVIETFDKLTKESKAVRSEHMAADMLGIGAGYLTDPLAKYYRAGKFATSAAKTGGAIKSGVALGTEVAIVEGQQAAVNTLARSLTEETPLAKIAVEEGIEMAGETALGFGLGAGFKVASSAVKTTASLLKTALAPVVRGISKLPWVKEAKAIVTENAEKLAKVKDKNQVKVLMKEQEAEVARFYTARNEQIRQALGTEKAGASILKPWLEAENVLAMDAIEAIGKRAPKDLADNIVTAQAVAEKYKKIVGDNFGIEMQEIARKSGGKQAITNLTDELYTFYKQLADPSGEALGTFNGKKFTYTGSSPEAKQFLEKTLPSLMEGKKNILQAMKAKVELGRIADWGPEATKQADIAARDLYHAIRGKIVSLIPEELVGRYEAANRGWVEFLKVKGSVQSIEKNFGNLAAFLKDGSKLSVEAFDKRLASTITKLETIYGHGLKMDQRNLIIGSIPKEHQLLYAKTLSQLKQVSDLKKISKPEKIKPLLKKLAEKGEGADVDHLKGLLDNNNFERRARDLYRNIDVHEKIKTALLNPTDKKAVSEALEFAHTYMPDVRPELQGLLNRAAHFQRKAFFKPELHNLLDGVEQHAPELVDEVLAGVRLEPKLQEYLTNRKMYQAYLDVATSAGEFAREGLLSAEGAGLALGVTAEMAIPGQQIQYILPVIGFIKALRNPQYVMLMLERMQGGIVKNPTLVKTLSTAAKDGARLAQFAAKSAGENNE